jgi:S-adenosylmethionine-diacylgycerolhomoserine-N-methlytransferase
MSQAAAMDRMYRYQRYIYDISRKYYLLGRDKLIQRMELKPGDRVLEMGCGTARNLMILAAKHPQVHFYGLDASQEMLNTAQSKINAKGLSENIKLIQCLAEDLHYQRSFALEDKFDAIFFSYALSMIPPWEQAIDIALKNLKPGGVIYIVDFSDQRDLPKWFQWLLQRWLALFGVHYPPGLLPYLEKLAAQGQGELSFDSLFGYYAFLAQFKIHTDTKHE